MNEKLMTPRLRLIKDLCRDNYGERNHTAIEMNEVIAENEIHLLKPNGTMRPDTQIQEAMSVAHKKLKG